ncbi:MAG: glycosyltransferase family 4 protein [Kiritimatiellae bacterium]|nr:glycosyltransferase family 4 protein [Kiritimatiellia bacterium]
MLAVGRKIKILYDDLGFREPHGGVSKYFTELVKNLPDDCVGRFSAKFSRNAYLQAYPFSLPPGRQNAEDFIQNYLHGHSFRGVSHLYSLLAHILPNIFPSLELANRRAHAAAVKKSDFDILHITDPHPHSNWWRGAVGKKKIVATVHDLIPELFHSDRRVSRMRRRILEDADHIIAVSNNTKNDLVRLYGAKPEKISVVYHGYTGLQGEKVAYKDLAVKPLTDRYLLFVGKRGGYKNFRFFIETVAPLLAQDKSLSVFCTGTPFSDEEKASINRLGIAEQVSQGFVDDSELPSLYANAVVFVYPSRYEGFGIPILDAFASGCPVVCSKASCFPEVAGDACLYFPLGDAQGLRSCILDLLSDAAQRERLKACALERVKLFSWQRCARETAEIYRKVCAVDNGRR